MNMNSDAQIITNVLQEKIREQTNEVILLRVQIKKLEQQLSDTTTKSNESVQNLNNENLSLKSRVRELEELLSEE